MRESIDTPVGTVRPDTVLEIVRMDDQYGYDWQATQYNGKRGRVTHIDDIGNIFGTWGGLALIPGVDEFKIISA